MTMQYRFRYQNESSREEDKAPWRDVPEHAEHGPFLVQLSLSVTPIGIEFRVKPTRTDAEILARLRATSQGELDWATYCMILGGAW